jgi:hypothetical protein
MTVAGTGCLGAREVGIHSTYVRLATVTPDATGRFAVTVSIPSDASRLPPGGHHLVVLGADRTMLASTPAIAVTAVGAAPLARTGSDALLVALVATVALALGSHLRLRARYLR